MASGAAARQYSSLINPSLVDMVLIETGCNVISVTNVTGNGELWFTVSEPGGPNPQPNINGANTYCAASVAGSTVDVRHDGMYGTIVNLASSASVQYLVSIQNKQYGP